jgi:hypothetical protein
MRRAGLLTAALLLAACGQKPADAPPKESAPAAPAPPSLAKANQSVALTCEKDLPITAIYGTNAEGKADVALIIKGDSFTLTEAAPGTGDLAGARYTTQYGLEPGMGLAWIVQGETALLQQAPFKLIDDPAKGQTVRTCKVKGENEKES